MYNVMNAEILQTEFKKSIEDFIGDAIPLGRNNNGLFFMIKNGSVFGIDKMNRLFEPNDWEAKSMVRSAHGIYFDSVVKEELKSTYGVDFVDLEKLNLRKENNSSYYYSKATHSVYSWGLVNKKWTKSEPDTVSYLFSNANIMEKKVYYPEDKSAESEKKLLEDFEIDIDDLIELPRFRDGCIHCYHPETDSVYTTSVFQNRKDSGLWKRASADFRKRMSSYIEQLDC